MTAATFPGMWFRRARASAPDPRQTLHEFSRALALIVDEGELHAVIAARLREVFDLESAAVVLREGDASPFRVAAARGVDADAAREASWPAEGRLARWLKVNATPLVLAEGPGVVAFLEPDERRALERAGAAACFPLVAGNQLRGFLLLGPRRGEPALALRDDERETAAALAAQAALAVENAALLREQKARLKRLYRAERLATAGELAAGAAHEIRNPLTAIRSASQYVRGDFASGSERASLLDDVLAEVDRIDGIVEGLLSFARPAAAELAPVDLAELLRQSAGLLAASARRQGVDVALDAPPELVADADANLIKQAVLNVTRNALQAMPGGGSLRLALVQNGRRVEVRVADTGGGIAPEHLDRIFDPFFTTKPDGTGLGLSIVHGIVQRHGGEVDVESDVGRGTTVTLRLPLRSGR